MDSSLIPQFGGLIWTVLAFVVALSIIVAIHEYGHYIVGRWCGIKADVFSIGFGPIIWSKMDRHGTRWQVAALPLGGYVKFRGDSNASSVGTSDEVVAMTDAERAQTMTGASLWRRSATVVAGPVFNFILSILVFGSFVLISGQAAEKAVIGELKTLPAEMVTLQEGDEIVSIAGQPVESLESLTDIAANLTPAPVVPYEVRRDGEVIAVEAALPLPARVELVQPRSAAWDIGIRPDDVIRRIDGEEIHSFSDLQARVLAGEGRSMDVQIWRAGETLDFTLVPRPSALPIDDGGFETRYIIGVDGAWFFEPVTERAGPLEAIGYGIERTFFIITSSLSAISHIATGEISVCNLSGPIGIAETSGAAASQGIGTFIWFIAVLSAAVGLLNLFPIPVLDGGHLVFHAYEAVARRPPPDMVVKILMIVGIGMMLSLMLFATFNDLVCP